MLIDATSRQICRASDALTIDSAARGRRALSRISTPSLRLRRRCYPPNDPMCSRIQNKPTI